jgi:plastocyanin
MKNPVKVLLSVFLVLAVMPACKKKEKPVVNPTSTSISFDFSWDDNPIAGTDITFRSTAPKTSKHRWAFGGTILTVAEPKIQFIRKGVYDVSLTIDDDYNNTVTKQITIGDKPYIVATGGICPGDTFYFSTPAYPAANTYNWNFGDGYTAATATPYHIFTTEGIYTVSVNIDNKMGASTIVQVYKDPIHTAKMTNSRTWHIQRRQEGYQLDTMHYFPDEVFALQYINKVTVLCPSQFTDESEYVYNAEKSKGNVLAYSTGDYMLYFDHVQDTIRITLIDGPGKLEGPYKWTTSLYTP